MVHFGFGTSARDQLFARREHGGTFAIVPAPVPPEARAAGDAAGAALASCFDAFSSREPVPIPDQVRDRLSLENALVKRALRVYAAAVAIARGLTV
jgi:hypothetical protein